MSTNPNVHMGARMVRGRRQGLGQLRFGRRERCRGISHKEECALDLVRARRSDERVDVVGIGVEGTIEKAARPRHIVRGKTLIEPSQTLKIEVHRVGMRGPFGAPRLGRDEFGIQRACQARDDFILHVEEIGEGFVKPVRPEMIAGFRVDELDIDAHAIAAALNAAFEDITHVQLAADLLQIDGLSLISEGGIARRSQTSLECAKDRSSGSP